MQKLELEAETIQISIYANIIMNILKKHGELDFMFGSSEDIRKKPWYRDSLKKASKLTNIYV